MRNAALPTLDCLRVNLDIPEINTGRQYPLTTPSGVIIDDLEGLHASRDEQGNLLLSSSVEVPMAVYRGQTQDCPCVPSLARRKHVEEQLVDLCRNAAFEDAIGDHPYVRICESTNFLDCPLSIDRQGIAQHYGLATNLLDLTSNFDVACFFATCRHDGNSWWPILQQDHSGILYCLCVPIVESSDSVEFRSVGWQPFPRPQQQRAFGIVMRCEQNLSNLPGVQLMKFRQDPEISNRIWKSFDEGRALFPNDAISALADQAKNLTQFTQSQIDRAWGRLDCWRRLATTADYRTTVELRFGATVVEDQVLTWDGLDIERDEEKLRNQLSEVLATVRYREARYL